MSLPLAQQSPPDETQDSHKSHWGKESADYTTCAGILVD